MSKETDAVLERVEEEIHPAALDDSPATVSTGDLRELVRLVRAVYGENDPKDAAPDPPADIVRELQAEAFCTECGVCELVDEDGCCPSCGTFTMGEAARDLNRRAAAEIERLRGAHEEAAGHWRMTCDLQAKLDKAREGLEAVLDLLPYGQGTGDYSDCDNVKIIARRALKEIEG